MYDVYILHYTHKIYTHKIYFKIQKTDIYIRMGLVPTDQGVMGSNPFGCTIKKARLIPGLFLF